MKTGVNRSLANKILVLVFLVSGVVELSLWYSGHANNWAAFLGVAYLCGVVIFVVREARQKP